jgi:putative heme iron utilization protein
MQENPWDFIKTIYTMHISSVNKDGTAHSSYAPFIENEEKFYISISGMSKHFYNLTTNKTISIMIIEDEAKSANLFARRRVSFDVEVEMIERNSLIFNGAMTLFHDRFGNGAGIYEKMDDFQLFELSPLKGRAVFGFGKAYDFKDGAFSTVAMGMGG